MSLNKVFFCFLTDIGKYKIAMKIFENKYVEDLSAVAFQLLEQPNNFYVLRMPLDLWTIEIIKKENKNVVALLLIIDNVALKNWQKT